MMRKTSVILLSAATGAALTLFVTQPRAVLMGSSARAATSDTYRQLNLFGDVFERVRSDYVEKPDDSKLVESAISGMLTGLDPHSSYMDAKSFRDMQVQTRGEFGGLGIEVTMEEGLVKVVTPIDETPASRAGILANDVITQIDGESVQGLNLNQAVDKMRGPVNSSVTLKIQRKEAKDPIEVKLTRETIRVRPVRARVEGDIGVLRVTQFNEQTFEGLRSGIEKLTTDIGADKVAGFVIDLRNNPGGLLDQAIMVSDAFLDRGEIVSTRGRNADETQRFNAKSGDLAKGKPVVVLINGGSASASEIVAGALQDHKRAIVLGTRSFGKGSVQTIMQVTGGGAIRLTTALYFTPSGRSIQKEGITPDIEVDPAKIENITARAGFREENLRRSILNPNPKPGEKPVDKPADPKPEAGKPGEKKDDKPQAAPGTPPAQSGDPDEPPKDAVADYQLLRAVDLVKGI